MPDNDTTTANTTVTEAELLTQMVETATALQDAQETVVQVSANIAAAADTIIASNAAAPIPVWDGTRLKFQRGSDEADLCDFVDLKGATGDTGPTGPTGAPGATGPKGDDGITPTFTIGTVATLLPGANATVSVTDNGSGLNTFEFGLPRGSKGDKGDTGATGPQGPQGEKGEKGDTGETGPQGNQGTAPTFKIGTVSTLAAGADATASLTASGDGYLINLGIPQGAVGDYAFKSDLTPLATKAELSDYATVAALTSMSQGLVQIVNELPTTGTEGVIYLVPTITSGVYDTYTWENDTFAAMGSSHIDLSDYVKDLSLSGSTITVTKGDDSTSTLVLPASTTGGLKVMTDPVLQGESSAVIGDTYTLGFTSTSVLNNCAIVAYNVTSSLGNQTINVSNTAGTASFSIPANTSVGAQFTFTVTATDSMGNESTAVSKTVSAIVTPVIAVRTPIVSANKTEMFKNETLELTGSEIEITGSEVSDHAKSDWKICATNNSSAIAEWSSLNDTINRTTLVLPKNTLTPGDKYIFVRYYDSELRVWSEWSQALAVNVKQPIVATVSVSKSTNTVYPNTEFTLTGSAFRVTGADTFEHSKSDWKICKSDSVSGTVEWSSLNDSENKTRITVPADNLTTGNRYLFVRYYDSINGVWSEWNEPILISVGAPFIAKPIVTDMPTCIAPNTALTVTVDAFSVTGGEDTHSATNWVIYDANDRAVVYSLNNSSDLLSHTFSASEISQLSAETPYKVRVQFLGTTYEQSELSQVHSLYITTKTISQGGRAYYRHSSDEGTVVVLDDYGRLRHVLVLDSPYRGLFKWGCYNVDTPLQNFNSANKLGGWYINGTSAISETEAAPVMTDAQLQAMWPSLSTDLSARENCDVWMTYEGQTDHANPAITGVPQVEHARSINITGITDGCDIPNQYELMVLRLEGMAIDNLDKYKDNATYQAYLLGPTNTQGKWFKFSNGSSYCFSSTEYSADYERNVAANGHATNNDYKNGERGCVPVREL